jgi:hypothetical protein
MISLFMVWQYQSRVLYHHILDERNLLNKELLESIAELNMVHDAYVVDMLSCKTRIRECEANHTILVTMYPDGTD